MNWLRISLITSMVIILLGLSLLVIPLSKIEETVEPFEKEQPTALRIRAEFDPKALLPKVNQIDPFRMLSSTPLAEPVITPTLNQTQNNKNEVFNLNLLLISSDGTKRVAWFLDPKTSRQIALQQGEEYNNWTMSISSTTSVRFVKDRQTVEIFLFGEMEN